MSDETPVGNEVATKVVKHVIEFVDKGKDGDKDLAMAKELQEKSDIISSLALKEFEEKKNLIVQKLVSKYGEDKREAFEDSIQSGHDIDSMENLLAVVDEGNTQTKNKVPSGKVHSQSNSGNRGEVFNTTQELIDSTYEALERQKYNQSYNPKEYDSVEHQRLQSMADRLLESAVIGMKGRGEIPRIRGITECFKCHASMSGDTCPKCGYKNRSYQDKIDRNEVMF